MRALFLLAVLALGACGLKPVDLAVMPQGTYGPGVDVDEGAIATAEATLGPATPPQTEIGRLALALASVEYLAGEYSAGGRWGLLNPLVQAEMMMARDEIRTALAVAPQATSQQVVDSLLAVSHATGADEQRAALAGPFFTLGAEPTRARLQAMPPLPLTRGAMVYVSHHLFDDSDLP